MIIVDSQIVDKYGLIKTGVYWSIIMGGSRKSKVEARKEMTSRLVGPFQANNADEIELVEASRR